MPIYEYRCQKCSHYVDVLQKVSDAPLVDCPACHEASLKRLISAPAFRLKGGGWYETDFKSDKEKRRNLADRPEGSANGSGKSEGSGKSDGGGKSDGSSSSGGESKASGKSESAGGTPKSGSSKSEAAV